MKIYVASSWRNERQNQVVEALRLAGFEVYDFKNPSETDKGFAWSDIDLNWEKWTNEEYAQALEHPIAIKGFNNDFNAMKWADVCVMVMPCGRSAHTEAGWMQGQGKPTIVLQEATAEPELMYKVFHKVVGSIDDVVISLIELDPHCTASDFGNNIKPNPADYGENESLKKAFDQIESAEKFPSPKDLIGNQFTEL